MRIKIIVISAVVLFLYLAKKKNDKKKEDKKLDEALKANEMPAADQLDVIRFKIEDFLKENFPNMEEIEQMYWVIELTSNLENYKQKYAPTIL